MEILAVYDTVGIQSYIFASNKLEENVGASKLVADVFAENGILPKIISAQTRERILPERGLKPTIAPLMNAEFS